MLDDINGGELAASLQRERPALRALFVVEDAGEADPRLALPAPEDCTAARTPRACSPRSPAPCRSSTWPRAAGPAP